MLHLLVESKHEVQQNAICVANEVGYAKKARKCIIPLVTNITDTGNLGMLSDLKWVTVNPSEPKKAVQFIQKVIVDNYADQMNKQRKDEIRAMWFTVGTILIASLFRNDD